MPSISFNRGFRNTADVVTGNDAGRAARASRAVASLTRGGLIQLGRAFDFPARDDKIKVFTENPERVIPAPDTIR
jgi:hypothetical protein